MPNSNRKGKVGERELANELSRLLGIDARRGVQYQGGPDSPDVVGLPGVHIECKRVEHFQLYPSLAQAGADAGDNDIPLVCHRKNDKPWVVVVALDDLPRLAALVFLLLAETA